MGFVLLLTMVAAPVYPQSPDSPYVRRDGETNPDNGVGP
jgi:hypothetical protein